ncbi:MAG: DUF1328 domain-containing protein [Hyphomonadaceae bacterium]
MLRLALGFFLLAMFSAVLGFGGFAGAFSTLAVLSFYVFLGLLVLALLAGLFAGGAHGHPGGVFSALIVAGLLGAGIYYWIDNGMSAQTLGASIDRSVLEARNSVEDVAQTAGSEAEGFVQRVDNAAGEAADGDGT